MTTGTGAGTFETLAIQTATLLAPVSRRLADGEILPLLAELGMRSWGRYSRFACGSITSQSQPAIALFEISGTLLIAK